MCVSRKQGYAFEVLVAFVCFLSVSTMGHNPGRKLSTAQKEKDAKKKEAYKERQRLIAEEAAKEEAEVQRKKARLEAWRVHSQGREEAHWWSRHASQKIIIWWFGFFGWSVLIANQ